MLKAVIFDLDGVIADTIELYYKAGKKLAQEIEVPYDRKLNQKLQGINRYKAVELMLGEKLKAYSREQIVELGDRKSRYYKESLPTISPEFLLPGIKPFLEELRNQQIKAAIASSSSNAVEVLTKLEVKPFFDYIVDIKKVRQGKPDPEIFLTAARGLGVCPRHCAAIEDGEAGLEGILKTDMFSVGVGTHKAMRCADWNVSSTAQLSLDELKSRFH
ncbi:MAG: beta-phosphoglucomutase [Bacillaceae bacterium]|nr:beta-phosphoglucomutase [Bacillaceae bacterium]